MFIGRTVDPAPSINDLPFGQDGQSKMQTSATKRDLIIAYNKLNQDLKWNTKKKEKMLFRKGDLVISYEKDLANWWEYQALLNKNKSI